MFFRDRQTSIKSISVLPQSIYENSKKQCRNERMSPCTLRKGSLTVEAAMIVPFFLLILLAFFGYFERCAMRMELSMKAAAEARTAAVVQGAAQKAQGGRIVIYKRCPAETFFDLPFDTGGEVTAQAVCRAWVGFRGLELAESYVYITPDGSVYHLFGDCTHLSLSVRQVSAAYAENAKNQYGQRYRSCSLCRPAAAGKVYIAAEGECYHCERDCSGLKRTVKSVPLSEAGGRSCCQRCLAREVGM